MLGCPCVEAIAHDHHDGAPGEDTSPVVAVEGLQGLADARAARPAEGEHGELLPDPIQIGLSQRLGDVHEAGVEDEGLRIAKGADQPAREAQEQVAVQVHGPTDVQDQNQAWQLAATAAVDQIERRAAVAQALAQGTAQMNALPLRADALTANQAATHPSRQSLHQLLQVLHRAGLGDEAEITVLDRLLSAGPAARRIITAPLAFTRGRPLDFQHAAGSGSPVALDAPVHASAGEGRVRGGMTAGTTPIGVEELIESRPVTGVTAEQAAQAPMQPLRLEQMIERSDAQGVDLLLDAHLETVVAQKPHETEQPPEDRMLRIERRRPPNQPMDPIPAMK